jgi:hypothetical protein
MRLHSWISGSDAGIQIGLGREAAACRVFMCVVPSRMAPCLGPSTQGSRLYSATYALKRIGILISQRYNKAGD